MFIAPTRCQRAHSRGVQCFEIVAANVPNKENSFGESHGTPTECDFPVTPGYKHFTPLE